MSSESDELGGRMLLHACCGPCSLEPTRIFAQEGVDFAIHYANSNIFPPEEYEHRLSTLREHVCEPQEVELIEGDYDPDAWEREVAMHGTDREARCRACYRLRFEETAREAAARGFDTISTTLTISPYQLTDAILEELEAAAERHGLKVDARDFRDRYREATRRSREKGMYRQNYCGCRFSDAEAAAEREERRAARRAAREAELAAHADKRAAAEAERARTRAEKQAYADKQAKKRAILKALREQQ